MERLRIEEIIDHCNRHTKRMESHSGRMQLEETPIGNSNTMRQYWEHRQVAEYLNELQQYRGIGTVEDLKTMKENGAFTGIELAQIATNQMVLKKYQEIGTVEECREAVERMKPKKPYDVEEREEADFYYLAFMCPSCDEAVIGQPYRPNYCKHCGQRLDWEE